jgi:hypothetical protein
MDIASKLFRLVGSLVRKSGEPSRWLNKGKQLRATGRNIGYIRQYHPQPHKLDDYELKRAIEESLV